MALKDLMQSDLSIFFNPDDGPVACWYETPDGIRVAFTGNLWDVLTESREVRGIQTIVSIRNLTIRTEDVPNVNLRATIIIDNTEWAITRIIYQDDLQVTVELQRHDLHEHARPGYRRQ